MTLLPRLLLCWMLALTGAFALASPAQAGDVSDTDSDGVVNNMDNCVFAPNPDQADLDQDDVGDACDSNIDGDDLGNDLDHCDYRAIYNESGCPSAFRGITLRYADGKFRGVLTTDGDEGSPDCHQEQSVTLFKVVDGERVKMATVTTSASGAYSHQARRRSLKYVAVAKLTVVEEVAQCLQVAKTLRP